MSPSGGLRTLGLHAWRELRSAPFSAALPFGIVASVWTLHDREVRTSALLVGVGVTALRAIRARNAGDAWWRGVGGPAWARVAGWWLPIVGTGWMACLVLAILANGPADYGQSWSRTGLIWAQEEALVYLAVGIAGMAPARALLSGARAWAGPALFAALYAAGAAGHDATAGWAEEDSGRIVGTVLVLAGFGIAIVAERVGPWQAAWRPRWLAVAAVPTTLVGLAAGVEAAWPWPTGRLRGVSLSADGNTVVRRYTASESPYSSGRAWRWRYGVQTRLPGAHISEVSLGAHGAVALTDYGRDTTWLVTDRATVACPSGGLTFRPDGREVGGLGQRITEAGCSVLPDRRPVGWLGDREARLLAESAEDPVPPGQEPPYLDTLLLDGAPFATIERTCSDGYPEASKLVQEGERLYVLTEIPDPATTALFLVTTEGVQPLDEDGEQLLFADGWCERDLGVCHTFDGASYDLPFDALPIAGTMAVATLPPRDHWESAPRTGAALLVDGAWRPIPEGSVWIVEGVPRAHGADQRYEATNVARRGDVVRIAVEDALLDIAPDGTITRTPYDSK